MSFFPNAQKDENGVLEVDIKELSEKQDQVEIIDVRRDEEYVGELGHIKSSKLITLETDLEDALDMLPRDKTYVFVCRSGMRSARAAMLAKEKGFHSVFNLVGGMIAWNEAELPTES